MAALFHTALHIVDAKNKHILIKQTNTGDPMGCRLAQQTKKFTLRLCTEKVNFFLQTFF